MPYLFASYLKIKLSQLRVKVEGEEEPQPPFSFQFDGPNYSIERRSDSMDLHVKLNENFEINKALEMEASLDSKLKSKIIMKFTKANECE